jgi:hypothetical protein
MSFSLDDFDSFFKPQRAILDTLIDFSSVVTPGSGAILYPRRQEITNLGRNIHAAAVASGLGLASLDYAKRRYVPAEEGPEPEDVGSSRLYRDAFFAAMAHKKATEEQLASSDDVPMGIFAASIALERLDSGFKSAHLLYQLGLNYEGDAVARYVLEQVAWSIVASRLSTLEEIEKVKSTAAIGELKKLIPWAGQLYGDLSKTTHAGLKQHQIAFMVDDEQRGRVLSTWSRLGVCAAHIMLLADAWSVAWEYTQAPYMQQFNALHSAIDRKVRADREFMTVVHLTVDAIDDAEALEQALRDSA